MPGNNNKEWLIKSSGEIKGPYTFDEVAQGIASKEIVVVDEISRAFDRWKYLRDEEAFEKIILEFKNKEFTKGEKTFTNSETDTLTEDLTKNVLTFRAKDSLLSNVTEHLREDEQSRATNKKTSTQEKINEEIQIKNYALESDLKKEVAKRNTFFRSLLLVILVGAAGLFYYLNKKEKPLSYDDLKKMAYDNINYGHFQDAKSYLERALAVNSTNAELKYLLSYVSVEVEDSITAQRLLTDLKTTATEKKMKSQVYNLLGILQLKNFDLQSAKKSFEDSLSQDSKFPAAYFNKGVAFFLENKFDKAHENFTQSLVHGGIDGNILLAMVEMLSRQPGIRTDLMKSKQAEDVLNLINRQSNNLYSHRLELKIAAAYLYFILGNNELFERYIDQAINIDPDLTLDHVQDVAYYKGLVTWDKISDWIKKMKDANPKAPNLNTLYGFSLFKGSEKLKGKDIIEGLLKSDYSNTANQIVHSYILLSLGREDEAKAAIAPIMHHRDRSLSFVLMGKICLRKKDYPCADLNFSEALRIDKGNISAMAGLAEVYYEQKSIKKSEDLVNQVYKISPNYKLILNVKQKIESSQKK